MGCLSSCVRVVSCLAMAFLGISGCGDSDDPAGCSAEQCGEFGQCGETDAGSACVCDRGYQGEDCSSCAAGYTREGDRCVSDEQTGEGDPCDEEPCGAHGSCESSGDDFTCSCDEGYGGDDCTDCTNGYHADGDACARDEQCEADSCSTHGSCDDSNGVVECMCDEGYAAPDCDMCAAGYHDAGGECVVDTECGNTTCGNGDCDDSSGVPVCTCDEGFGGERCDECANGYHADAGDCLLDEVCEAGSCPTNADCDDTGGVVTCTCAEPFVGDDCEQCETPLELSADGECVEPCPTGQVRGEAAVCVPDCAEGTTLVDAASVDPTTLMLPEGYTLLTSGSVQFPDGSTLTLQRVGTWVCVPLGYTCDDYDPCSATGSCDDSEGVPMCVCDAGYTGLSCDSCVAGYHADGVECLADETCAATSCSSRGVCDDSSGELECACDTGASGASCGQCISGYYAATDGSCQPEPTCEPSTCSGHGSCNASNGVLSCTCFAGYAGTACEECDIGFHLEGTTCLPNETCDPTSCSEVGTCDDSTGAISCTCDTGYTGSNCGLCDEGYTRANNVCTPLPTDACDANSCNAHGTCDDSTGSVVCTCDFPYTGLRCGSCTTNYVLHPGGICALSVCGDGIADGRSGEQCDPGGATDIECAYGPNSCSVCGGPAPVEPVSLSSLRPLAPSKETRSLVEPEDEPEPEPEPGPDPYDPENHCQYVPGVAHFCGDGVLDSGEECDDGFPLPPGCALGAEGQPLGNCAAANNDGCTVSCKVNVCGDGYRNPAAEECDDTVNDAAYGDVGECGPGCELANYCGNGICDEENEMECEEPGPIVSGLGPTLVCCNEDCRGFDEPGSMTTLFASNNGQAGNTFDIEALVDMEITGFDVNMQPGSLSTIAIYWRTGTSNGFQSDPSGWTLLGTDDVVPAGLVDNPTHVDVGGLVLTAGQLYGFYIEVQSYPSSYLLYTNGGPTTFSNSDLELTSYYGKSSPAFSGSSFFPRQWNGTVYYLK